MRVKRNKFKEILQKSLREMVEDTNEEKKTVLLEPEKLEQEEEGVSQSKRAAIGYGLEEPVDYTDVSGLEKKEEGVSQSKRAVHGYANEEPKDYPQTGDGPMKEADASMPSLVSIAPINEVSPPSKKAEEFIRGNKDSFKKRYGDGWKEKLYSAAWSKFGKKNV